MKTTTQKEITQLEEINLGGKKCWAQWQIIKNGRCIVIAQPESAIIPIRGFGDNRNKAIDDLHKEYNKMIEWIKFQHKFQLPLPKMPRIPQKLIKIAKENSVKVSRSRMCEKNHGKSADPNIYLGVFDSKKIEIIAFFHELGHILANRKSILQQWINSLVQEAVAWNIGLEIAKKYGYSYDFYSDELKYARKCLASYIIKNDNLILEEINI
jgi:hypothetical protein